MGKSEKQEAWEGHFRHQGAETRQREFDSGGYINRNEDHMLETPWERMEDSGYIIDETFIEAQEEYKHYGPGLRENPLFSIDPAREGEEKEATLGEAPPDEELKRSLQHSERAKKGRQS